jgi:ubiquinol-cytochrome c reductase cytochrome b subunit
LTVHLAIVWRQKHTQFPNVGHTEHNVVGSKLWPTYTAKSIGLFAAVFAVAAALAGLAQINPIWLYGPYRAGAVSTAAQPDWYMGWLEGALRLFPPWRIHLFHHTIPEVFWPGAVLPALTFGLLYLWPFIEARLTGDFAPHELLDRPRNRPLRTALGTATLSFYIVLFLGGSQDVLAQHLGVSVFEVNHAFQALIFVVPLLVGGVTFKWCWDLALTDARTATGPPGWPLVPGAPPPAPPTSRLLLRQRARKAARRVATAVGLVGVAAAIRGVRRRTTVR